MAFANNNDDPMERYQGDPLPNEDAPQEYFNLLDQLNFDNIEMPAENAEPPSEEEEVEVVQNQLFIDYNFNAMEINLQMNWTSVGDVFEQLPGPVAVNISNNQQPLNNESARVASDSGEGQSRTWNERLVQVRLEEQRQKMKRKQAIEALQEMRNKLNKRQRNDN